MNDVLIYVTMIAGLILFYGLLIFAVSYLVSGLQAKSDLPDDNETWAKSEAPPEDSGDSDGQAEDNPAIPPSGHPLAAAQTLADVSMAEIPVASVAEEVSQPDLDASPENSIADGKSVVQETSIDGQAANHGGSGLSDYASDWSGNYVAPSDDVILAYENLAGLDYSPIGFGKSMLISLATATVSSVVMTLLLGIYVILSFAFQLQMLNGPILAYCVMLLSFFGVGLLMRLGFEKAAFGPTALAVAIETLLIFGLLSGAYLWWQ